MNSDVIEQLYKDLDKLDGFPQKDMRLSALSVYVNFVEEFISHTADQAELRLLAKANREIEGDVQGQMLCDVDLMNRESRYELSHTVCGALLVSIYFAFESSTVNIIDFLSKKSGSISFSSYKKKNSKKIQDKYKSIPNFLVIAHHCSKDLMGVPLFTSNEEYGLLNSLRIFRNSYVHSGCSVESLDENTRFHLLAGEYESIVGFENGIWFAKNSGLKLFLRAASICYSNFYKRAIESL